MKIAFRGLGPQHSVTHGGKIYFNGSIVDMSEEAARMYINAKLAFEVATAADEAEAKAIQALEVKNKTRREAIKAKAEAQKEAE